jgi:hypothetical protein
MSRRPLAAKWLGIQPGASNPAVAAPVAATYNITGTINDALGSGLDGVTVTLTGDAGDSTVTAGGGAYSFTGLAAGSYTVTPTLANTAFSPASDAVTIVAANVVADAMAVIWPQSLNFEGESPGEADFSGLSLVLGTPAVQASDQGDMPAMSPENLTQCMYKVGSVTTLARFLTTTGIAYANGIVWMEGLFYCEGTNALGRVRCMTTDGLEGIEVGLEQDNFVIRTYTGGSGTVKATVAHGFSDRPHDSTWFRLQFKYNFGTLAYEMRAVEMGATETEDSGWKTGTIVSPTYSLSSDLVKFDIYCTTGGATSDQGMAQLWVGNGSQALPDGALVTNTRTIN